MLNKRPALSPNTINEVHNQTHHMEIEDDDSYEKAITRQRAITISYSSPKPKTELFMGMPEEQGMKDFKNLASVKTGLKADTSVTEEDENYFDQVADKIKGFRFGRFLERHGIKEKFRVKMLDWMIEVLGIYQQSTSTLFKSLFILDLYYDQSQQKIELEELHLNGMVCMMIASKAEEVNFIKLKAVTETIGRNKFSREQIMQREVEILKAINFRTNFPTIYDLLRVSFRYVRFTCDKTDAFFRRSAFLLAKMCLFSYDLLTSLSLKEIALYSIIIALKVSQKHACFNCDHYVS